MNPFDFNRVMILGNNGSGKSFLSKKLAAITGLPLVHLDAEFWLPGWGMPTEAEWLRKNAEFISRDKWIIDGMCSHGGTMDLRFAAADLVIFLDVNRWVCLAGVIGRQGKKRADTAAGHERDEKFDRQFLGFCKGILSFDRTRKAHILDLHRAHPEKPFFVIGSRREMNRWIGRWWGANPPCSA